MQPHGYRNDGGLMRGCVLKVLRDKDEIVISTQDTPTRDHPNDRLLLRINVDELRRLIEQSTPELLATAPVEDRP